MSLRLMNASAAFLFIAACLPALARAQCPITTLADATSVTAHFGTRVAIDGDFAIVGAPDERNGGGTVVGGVYLYHRSGGSWTLEAHFLGNGSQGLLGGDVAISSLGFAAATKQHIGGFNSGELRWYKRASGGTWTSTTVAAPAGYGDFPSAVAISGDDLLVGIGYWAFGSFGDVLHFRYNVGPGTLTQLTLIESGTQSPTRALAFDGTVALLGHPDDGEVEVRRRTSSSSSDWTFAGALAPLDPEVGSRFGAAVAVSQTPTLHAVVGAPLQSGGSADEGAAYVFRFASGNSWPEEQKLTPVAPTANGHFGSGVATNGATIAVGAEDAAAGAGLVYLFDADPTPPIWTYISALRGDGLASTASFGTSVALEGTSALVGAPEHASGVGAALYFASIHCEIAPYCFGDGSGTPCPCGNASAPGANEGCLNSFGTGGRLTGTGSVRVTNDTFQLQASGTPPTGHAPTFFQSTASVNGGLGTVFGDGLRCASGAVIRLGTRVSSNGSVSFGFGIPGDPLVSVQGAIPAVGGTRYYQVTYRNSFAFCTPATFNLTNGVRVVWSP
jgi:hypothetical protein